MFEILIKNQISKKFRFHPCIKTILWKPMRNKLSSIIFISNCYCMFPSKCNVHNEFIRCYSKHFSCLKFFSLFNITMKCSFSMTSNSKSRITFCWSFYRIFIFFYYFSKLTLFPSISNFNSHPHKEDDSALYKVSKVWDISTYILTKRMTVQLDVQF